MKNLITNITENGIVWTAKNYCYYVPIEKIYKSLKPRWYTIGQNGNLLERIAKKIWVAANKR